MADSFTLKGAKTVVKNVGSAVRINPSRGGDTHQFPRWWSLKNRVQYFDAAIFKVTLNSGTVVRLVIPVDAENTEVTVKHDGDGNFTFPRYRGVDRIAVVADDNSIYKEYQFPAISKGAILTRTVTSYPTPPPATFAERAAAANFDLQRHCH